MNDKKLIKKLFPKLNINEYDNDFYKKRIPYVSLQQISMLSDEEKENITDEDIIKYAYIDIFENNKAAINYIERDRIFDCLEEMKLPSEKLFSCKQTYSYLHDTIQLPYYDSTIQYLECLMIKNNMDIPDNNDKDLQKFRNYLKFINMEYKDLKKLPAEEIVNNILLLIFYRIRDIYSLCSYKDIESFIDYLKMNSRKTESCKKYLFNLKIDDSKYFSREEIADILGIDYFKKTIIIKSLNLNKIRSLFHNNSEKKAKQKVK